MGPSIPDFQGTWHIGNSLASKKMNFLKEEREAKLYDPNYEPLKYTYSLYMFGQEFSPQPWSSRVCGVS